MQKRVLAININRRIIAPIILFLGLACIPITIWWLIQAREDLALRDLTDQYAHNIVIQIQGTVDSRIAVMNLLGEQIGRKPDFSATDFEPLASLHLSAFSGLAALTWVDRNYVLRWAYPLTAPVAALIGRDARTLPTAPYTTKASAFGMPVATPPMDLLAGGYGFVTAFPVKRAGEWVGSLGGIVRIDDLMRVALGNQPDGNFDVTVSDDNLRLFSRGAERVNSHFGTSRKVQVLDRTWTVRVSPREDYVATLKTPTKNLLLLLGLGMSAGIALMYLAAVNGRRRAELNQRRFQDFARSGTDWLWELDADYRFVYLSPQIQDHLGYPPATLVGESGRELPWGEDNPPEVIETYRRIMAGWQSFRDFEYRAQTSTGGAIVARLAGSPVFDEMGRFAGFRGTGTNMTAEREARQTAAQAMHDLSDAQAQLAHAQKMEAIGRLAGGVAHDFNNMLGVILGHVEIALGQVDPVQPVYADLQEIRRAAERSAGLTHQLLAFARKQTVSPKVLDLNETVEGTLKMLRRLIGEDIQLAWLPGVDLWPVKIDPSQIDQILANLCVNARDAITGVGKVTIETKNVSVDKAYCADHAGFVPGEYVMFAVSDTGCGMDKEVLGKLFEPFFTTKETGKGTGLGLPMIYGIVKQNEGFISVCSEPNVGTTFRIYLPRHAGKAESARTEGSAGPAMRGQETILLAEDEPAMLELITMLLQMQGYTVLAARTPVEAIRLAGEHTGEIHLLITDVVMPEMNGRDLAKNLLSHYPGLKCLFTSGYTANVIAHHGVLDEGVHFIQKPFSRNNLAAKVREVLDSS